MSSTMSWPDAIEEYLRDQQQVGRVNSERTVRAYRRVLRVHARDTPAGPLGASRDDIKRTLARWSNSNTRAREHAVLSSFYDWMLTEAYRNDNPARQVARSKRHPTEMIRFTRSEVEAMIAACETQRERWVIMLGVCTGARANELMAFQGRHFARPGFVWFSSDIAKGAKERWVPVLPELEPIVREIRAIVPSDRYVIETYKNSSRTPRPRTYRIGYASLSKIVRTVARRAGITTRVHPHLLRHAFGDHVAKHAGLRVAQALMGHASVQTTASVYVDRPDLDEVAASVRGLCYGGDVAVAATLPQIMAAMIPLIDQARAAGMDMDMIAAQVSGAGPIPTTEGSELCAA